MKQILNIDQLNALNMQYESKLSSQHILKIVGIPALYVSTLVYCLFFQWWLIPIGMVTGAVYGGYVLLPLKVRSSYQQKSLRERNRFVNNFSQSMHRQNITILDALKEVSSYRLSGELKQDIDILAYSVATHSEVERKQAYSRLIEKYQEDRIFVQFIEHIITVDINGTDYLLPLDETALAHDKAVEWLDYLLAQKKEVLLYFVTNNLLAFALCVAVIWLTWKNHIEWFVKSPFGWVFGFTYLGMTFFYNHRFVVDYNDEQIMEVKI